MAKLFLEGKTGKPREERLITMDTIVAHKALVDNMVDFINMRDKENDMVAMPMVDLKVI